MSADAKYLYRRMGVAPDGAALTKVVQKAHGSHCKLEEVFQCVRDGGRQRARAVDRSGGRGHGGAYGM